jgi:ankyrin repeat protein
MKVGVTLTLTRRLLSVWLLMSWWLVYAGSFDDFFAAVKRDDEATVVTLLLRGFDPNTVGANGNTGLMLAIHESSFKVANLLLSLNGIKAEVRNAADESPLMLAAMKGDLNLCKLLLKKGADVNKPGWAPLHYAATGGDVNTIHWLLDENAYIDAASPNRTTPLMMAARYGSEGAVIALLQAGADATLKNDRGLNATDFANKVGRANVAALIAEAIRARQPRATW